jgi:hypothetical protein
MLPSLSYQRLMGIHGRLDETRFKPIYERPIPVIKANFKVPILKRQLE